MFSLQIIKHKMMKITLLLSFLMTAFFFNLNVNAQQTRDFSKYEHKHAFHSPWIGNNKFLTNYLKEIDYENQENPMYSIPVKFYVFGKNNAPQLTDVKETIQNLNEIYTKNNTLISFYLHDIKFIKKKKFDKFGYYGQFPFQSIFRHKRKVLNIFLVTSLKKPGKKNKNLEYAGACNNLNHTVIIANGNDGSVVSHEVGHFFGLKHPHKNYNKGKHNQEAVDRDAFRGGLFLRGRNCEINGDGLSDTQAQPHLVKYTDKKCNYTAPDLTDKRGEKYSPQTDNIMSYTLGKQCRRNFTPMQKAVMLYTAAKRDKSGDWKLSFEETNLKITTLTDSFEPDFCPEIASILKDKIVQEHTLNSSDTDYLKFSLSKKADAKKSKIVIEDGKYGNADLKIEVLKLNSDNVFLQENKIYQKKQGENLIISLEDFSHGNYCLKITSNNKVNNSKLASYKIVSDISKPEIN